jgi:hypothetical protein
MEARQGRGDRRRPAHSDGAVEESLRRDLKLDVLDKLWAKATMYEAKAPSSLWTHGAKTAVSPLSW